MKASESHDDRRLCVACEREGELVCEVDEVGMRQQPWYGEREEWWGESLVCIHGLRELQSVHIRGGCRSHSAGKQPVQRIQRG